ncbi:hypothetical protein QPK31_02785 [Massilia sp. YIM B02769]|uniref:hypothetical protein n=1 Tax=Massilia sp. YIM B02769 TaxID=3050129 RepID=UPI0025B67C84|nr:hypothetical protein [Massilia sp. YIM B02769]MDN4057143.1 hypothetical protein [Massilia sp. YIM B02769]
MTNLENAHRALAAQHTALLEVCRVLLPLIPTPPELVGQALDNARDHCNAHMDECQMDDEYQARLRKWLDILSSEVLAGCKSR